MTVGALFQLLERTGPKSPDSAGFRPVASDLMRMILLWFGVRLLGDVIQWEQGFQWANQDVLLNLLEAMPMNAVDLKAYNRVLNDYHCELLSVAFLSAHLLDLAIDVDCPEWQKSACHLMRTRIVEMAEGLPFPEVSEFPSEAEFSVETPN